ncbi:hypothetical protein CH063_08780, partial [Colletotrichum higginsianum]
MSALRLIIIKLSDHPNFEYEQQAPPSDSYLKHPILFYFYIGFHYIERFPPHENFTIRYSDSVMITLIGGRFKTMDVRSSGIIIVSLFTNALLKKRRAASCSQVSISPRVCVHGDQHQETSRRQTSHWDFLTWRQGSAKCKVLLQRQSPIRVFDCVLDEYPASRLPLSHSSPVVIAKGYLPRGEYQHNVIRTDIWVS